MTKRVLITGIAGSLGSHFADERLGHGYQERLRGCLSPQVHPIREIPASLDSKFEVHLEDVCDPDTVTRTLEGIDTVYHFAAAVGAGQSMYEIAQCTSISNLGTAVLLEALSKRAVERLIVASSMSIYGEGLNRDPRGRLQNVSERSSKQFGRSDWERHGQVGEPLVPLPTPESKIPMASSVDAFSKYDQERFLLIVGGVYRIPNRGLAILPCLWTAAGTLAPRHQSAFHSGIPVSERSPAAGLQRRLSAAGRCHCL